MSLDASIDEAHRAGVGCRAIYSRVDHHPFRVLGKVLFGSGFKLKGGKEDASRRAGVMIRTVDETLVVNSLFLSLSMMSEWWDDSLTGAGLQCYVAETGAMLESGVKPEENGPVQPDRCCRPSY